MIFWNMPEFTAPADTTSRSLPRSTPDARAVVAASATSADIAMLMKLLISFSECAEPSAPMWNTLRA